MVFRPRIVPANKMSCATLQYAVQLATTNPEWRSVLQWLDTKKSPWVGQTQGLGRLAVVRAHVRATPAYHYRDTRSIVDKDLDGFVAWLRRRNRTRSIPQYTRVIRRYLDNPSAVEGMMADQSYAPNYRRHLAACVRSWARFSEDGELLVRLDEIQMPAALPISAREPFSWDTWWTIQDAIVHCDLPDAIRLVCQMIALRGIRCGDVLRLQKRELVAARDTDVLAFEGKAERRIEYSAEPLRPFIDGLLELPWERKRRVHQLISPTADTAGRRVRYAFDRIARELDMDSAELHAHRFRHTYAHFFLQELAGDPEAIFKLQEQMGWAKLETAANYLRRSRRKELNEIESKMLSDRKRPKGSV